MDHVGKPGRKGQARFFNEMYYCTLRREDCAYVDRYIVVLLQLNIAKSRIETGVSHDERFV